MFNIKSFTDVTSLSQLFEIMNKDENAKLVAGGTDVLVKLRDNDEQFAGGSLIGITRIPELSTITLDQEETLCIGAACSFTTVEKHELTKKLTPVLAYAVSTVGGPQTRNVGTIGGNVCNGATSADSAPTLFAYNTILELHSQKGVREVKISDFYQGPGRVDLQPGEVLVTIKIKKQEYFGFIGHYTKFAQRKALDIANLSCTTLVKQNDHVIEELRIAYGVAGPTPLRATEAEEFAVGKEINAANLDAIGDKCLNASKARDSWRASKEYREHLIKILPGRNINTALGGN